MHEGKYAASNFSLPNRNLLPPLLLKQLFLLVGKRPPHTTPKHGHAYVHPLL